MGAFLLRAGYPGIIVMTDFRRGPRAEARVLITTLGHVYRISPFLYLQSHLRNGMDRQSRYGTGS